MPQFDHPVGLSLDAGLQHDICLSGKRGIRRDTLFLEHSSNTICIRSHANCGNSGSGHVICRGV